MDIAIGPLFLVVIVVALLIGIGLFLINRND
jgi:hypothetical protein